jgi:signal peptidase I
MKDARRASSIVTVAWLGAIVVSVILTGCPRFSLSYVIFFVVSLAIAAAGLLFLNGIWRKGSAALVFPLKKFIGYAVAAQYIAHALPRVEWTNAGLIGSGRAAFIYALTLLCTGLGLAAFFILGRRSVLLAFGTITEEEAHDAKLFTRKKRARIHGVVRGALDWVDSLASAVIIVLLIEIFVFQLYAVPSESMVPVFLGGDRPFTVKALEGPRLPLTDWRLPFIRQPHRGDVVTIANPRYPENHQTNLKKTLSQFVYMVTFTLVNIDSKEPDGSPKADPLVKRVVGMPGEKLMMVDDVLYARTAAQPEFQALKTDRERYAQVDLWKLPPAVRARVQVIPVDENARAILDSWDRKKNELDAKAAAAELAARWQRLQDAMVGLRRRTLPALPQSISDLFSAARAFAPGADNPLSQKGPAIEDVSLLYAAVSSETARAAVGQYFTAGLEGNAGPTLYARGSRALNLLIKANLLSRMERDAAVLASGASLDTLGRDAGRGKLTQETRELYVYLTAFYDARNFPEFPAGGAFLGADQYFAMGDNRYNSLDFRFSTARQMRALDPSDPASVFYPSSLDPFPLEKRYIEGWAIFRLWPPARMGVIR